MSTDRTRVELWSEVPAQIWRVVEVDGLPSRRWLPHEPAEGAPLDRYGFDSFFGALFFSLGIDWIRADAGLLEGVTADDVERERERAGRLEGRQGVDPPAQDLALHGVEAFELRARARKLRRTWQAGHAERALRLVSAL